MSKSNASAIRQVAYSVAVTPSDDDDLPNGVTRAILVSDSGVVKVGYANGETDTITLVSGIWHPMEVARIYETGTTDTDIHAGY